MTKNFKLLKTGTCLLFAGILSISLLFEGSVPATAYAKAKDTAVEEESSENSTEKDSSKKDSEQTTGEKIPTKKNLSRLLTSLIKRTLHRRVEIRIPITRILIKRNLTAPIRSRLWI